MKQDNQLYFNVPSALDTIHSLDFVRVCGSEGERRAMEIITQELDETGVDWHYHEFSHEWLEPDDPHLFVKGKKIAVRPAVELQYHHGASSANCEKLCVDVRAELASSNNCGGKIAITQYFDPEKPIAPDAVGQLITHPFDPVMEAHMWYQQERDSLHIPSAIVAPQDISFVLDALGEPAELKWSVKAVDRGFRNLVVEIPGKEKPDEIVVMGAHTDSWPGTVGASDDAAGCAILIEAARWFAIHQPARTVRLIWFTGEEIDSRGSGAYVRECVDNPSAIKLMVNVDSTCEVESGDFTVYTSDESTYEWAHRRLDLDGMEHSITKALGIDAGAFVACGIPVFGVEATMKPAAWIAHMPDDTPENIDINKLRILGSRSLGAVIHAAG